VQRVVIVSVSVCLNADDISSFSVDISLVKFFMKIELVVFA